MIQKLTLTEFINRASIVHKNKYDYSTVNYITARIPVSIICPIHGCFNQTPDNHLRGQKCIKCSIVDRTRIRQCPLDEFINKSNIVHNKKFDYSKVRYKNCDTKVVIICPKHGEFSQIPYSHLIGKGCPKCILSKGELKIINWMNNNAIKYDTQKIFDKCRNPVTNKCLKFDFYVPSKNLLVEYDGEQHFNIITSRNYKMTDADLCNNKYRDELKNQFTKLYMINLLRIKYTQISDIDAILTSAIL